MSASSAFNDEKGGSSSVGEPEYGHDPASGGIFSSDYKRHDDLKEMLDSNKDSLKLEAMKRIVAVSMNDVCSGMPLIGRFPAACRVKKLVYVYLVRYAEEQQDLALLSISTFQRGLKDPNQLIRASALRVLSSIRVTIIVPIMMLAIKEAASDMSPYVRKTAAHAIPKLYSLDPEQKDQLIEVIEKLLADKTTLVAGSVVMAFEEVCPERIDLIHKNYRKLCNLLIDVEEWGQVVIINMLTRYARTQFLNPNINESLLEEGGGGEKTFYGSDEDEDDDDEDDKEKKAEAATLAKRKPYVMDPDHRLLLRNTKPLLQSRNAAVVMAVAQLYFHLAPKAEIGVIAKALVRLLRSHSEVQYVVLQNVATMTIKRRGMFEPYLKSFYIRSTDPTQIKVLKLEVLTNLANETNISTILREFQTYIKSMDKDFVAATIQAIGRCATNIGEVRDTCLNGLVQLLSNRDELVVAESVVVIKKLLQMQPEKHSDIIKHMAKLTDNIQVPMARASILWLIGEYCEHVPKIAPDVLRKMAKSFTNEEDIVKLQIINLSAKLYLTNSKQTKLLTQYVLNLAKYDQNYDIRDRARFIRQLIVPTEKSGALSKYAKKLFLALKPAPVLESPFKDRDHFQLGSLSHLLNAKAGGYQELPDWPEAAPDPSVRNVETEEVVSTSEGRIGLLGAWREVPEWTKCSSREKRKEKKVEKPFYSDSEGESGPTESADSGNCRGAAELDSASGSESGSGSEESGSGSESDESEEGSESEQESEEDKEEDKKKKKKELKKPVLIILHLLLCRQTITPCSASKSYELLHRITGEGLSVEYCFSRQPFSPDGNMVAVQVQFNNSAASETKNLHMEDVKLQCGMRVKEFPEIELLPAGEAATAVMGIDFCDSTQAANFQLCTHTKKFFVSIQPPVGELMRPVFLTENEFKKEQGQLMGMNEITERLTLDAKCRNEHTIVQRVTTAANLSRVPCGSDKEFAGRTVTSGSLVLVSVVTKEEGAAQLTVNCEKMVIGTMLVKDILLALTQ
uniref:AP-3 complex subunit beta n=1 Tax=Scophthalmus maximus TaxID=52904 RepID=A0A8D3CPB4_SCOMX